MVIGMPQTHAAKNIIGKTAFVNTSLNLIIILHLSYNHIIIINLSQTSKVFYQQKSKGVANVPTHRQLSLVLLNYDDLLFLFLSIHNPVIFFHIQTQFHIRIRFAFSVAQEADSLNMRGDGTRILHGKSYRSKLSPPFVG